MSDNYRLLLLKATLLYERHEAGRRDPFNVFSVLRSGHDEVNLHSRFLHALLDYRQPSDEHRENLEDFLRSIVGIDKLNPDDAMVERESDNIDILIRDPSSRQAVIIENKIWAGDQPQQLKRYAEQLERERYTPHLLYLTLDGRAPSEDSAKGLDPKCIKCISYKDNIPPWLKSCQKRAYDEPTLRESVAQYLHLIEEMTGKDYSEAYMKELKELCLQDDNLVLVHDLNEAMIEARVSLLHKLWQEIACKLREAIPDLPALSEENLDIAEERIRRFVTYQRNYRYHGIRYKFGRHAFLAVEVEDSIYFGVICPKEESEDEYYRLKEALKEALGQSYSNEGWPWFRYAPDLNLKYPIREHLKLLVKEDKRQEYVEAVVSGVGDVWKSIKDAGLA